jgi:hypothetical protein
MALVCLAAASPCTGQGWSQVGERAQGMGGAFVAVADDATATYWNPAGLATGSTFDAQVDLSVPQGPQEPPAAKRPMFVGAALPALGLAYYHVRSAVSSSADRKTGQESRPAALETDNFGVTLVQTVVNTVVAGSTVRVVHGGNATSVDVDAGGMASMGWLRVGLAARNLREALGTQRQFRVGTAVAPRSLPTGVLGPFTVAADVDLTRSAGASGEWRHAAIGSEQWWIKGAFGTRLGVQWNTLGDANPALAAGVTVRLPWSAFVEGHLTKGDQAVDQTWGIGIRATF